MNAETRIKIYTDGSCLDNPGPGGWAAIVQYPDGGEKEISDGEEHTTNNRMELTAAIMSLLSLAEPAPVKLVTDSKYVRDGITSWIHGWKKKNWVNSAGDPVKNKDLWEQLDAAMQRHEVEWEWVKGHAGDELNERCDRLARDAAERMKG